MKIATYFPHNKGFTLFELMIVLSITATLLGIGIFPFSYYMERARVEKNMDMIGQEWLMLHEDIRNGLLYDDKTHAHMEIEMTKGSEDIIVNIKNNAQTSSREYKKIHLEKPLKILEFVGTPSDIHSVKYHISPPFATGAYSLNDNPESPILNGIIMKIGYPDATAASGKSREILLRPRYE